MHSIYIVVKPSQRSLRAQVSLLRSGIAKLQSPQLDVRVPHKDACLRTVQTIIFFAQLSPPLCVYSRNGRLPKRPTGDESQMNHTTKATIILGALLSAGMVLAQSPGV